MFQPTVSQVQARVDQALADNGIILVDFRDDNPDTGHNALGLTGYFQQVSAPGTADETGVEYRFHQL